MANFVNNNLVVLVSVEKTVAEPELTDADGGLSLRNQEFLDLILL